MRRRLGSAAVILVFAALAAPSPAAGDDAGDVPVTIVQTDAPWRLVTDPGLLNTTARILDYGPAAPTTFSATWTLADSEGTTVVGPVDAGSADDRLLELDIDLAATAAAGLDGDYVLSVTNTVATPDGTRSGTVEQPVTLTTDPPAGPPPIGKVLDGIVRVARPGYEEVGDPATFSTSRPGAAGHGFLVIRDGRGRIVYRERHYAWESWPATWDGYSSRTGRPVPRGAYSASALVPDRYGRRAPVSLGAVHVLAWTDTERTVHAPARATLRAPAHGSRSRILHVRLPAWSGNLDWFHAEVRVAPVGDRPARVTVAARVPGVSAAWAHTWHQDGRGWLDGGPWQVPVRAARTPAAGQRVDVRVTVSDGATVRITGVGVAGVTWHWAS